MFDLIRKIVVGEEVTEEDLTITLRNWCNCGNCGDCPINEDELNSTKLFPVCDVMLDGKKMIDRLNKIGYFSS